MKKRISILLPISVALILLTLLIGIVSAAGSRENSPRAVTADGIKSDDFNQAALAPFWTHIIAVSGDPAPVMTGSAVQITVPGGASHDIWRGGNFSSRIMQPAPDTDFEVEVKFNSGVNDTYQMQGILVEQDSDDFLRFEFFGEDGMTHAYGAEFEAGEPVWFKNVIIQPGDTKPLYLRITRQGNNWTYNYGLDGNAWNEVIARTLTRTLTVNSVGIYAANHNSPTIQSPQHTTIADYFYNTANPGPFDLIVTENGDGNVEKSPAPDIPPKYSASQFVTLTPMPDPGWNFAGWSGPDAGELINNGNGTWSITMDDNKAITASFVTSIVHVLTVNKVGNGDVVLNPPGGFYDDGQVVMLTPMADLGWDFTGWSGPDAGSLIDNGNGTWSITMDGDKNVTANFVQVYQPAVFVPMLVKP